MKKRFFTGFLIFILVAIAFLTKFLTNYVFDALVVFIACVACYELNNAYSKNGKSFSALISVSFPIVLYIGIAMGLHLERDYNFYLIYFISAIVLFYFSIFFSYIVFKADIQKEINYNKITSKFYPYIIKKSFVALSVMIYPALLFMALVFFNNMDRFFFIKNTIETSVASFSVFMLLLIFVSTMFVDTFAMFTGMLFKGPKLCPKISPKKTVSGAIGGLVFAIISTISLFLIFSSLPSFVSDFQSLGGTIWHILLLGTLAGIFTQVGDLFESAIKRKAGIKDMGNYLPGHGGVLDRADGLIVNATVMFIFTIFFLF